MVFRRCRLLMEDLRLHMNLRYYLFKISRLVQKTNIINMLIFNKRHTTCDDINVVRNCKFLKFHFTASCRANRIASVSDKMIVTQIHMVCCKNSERKSAKSLPYPDTASIKILSQTAHRGSFLKEILH
jgi:hypothetical protein